MLIRGAFNNYVDRILQILTLPPCVDSFVTLSVDKSDIFDSRFKFEIYAFFNCLS
jgi:hypothetical protein